MDKQALIEAYRQWVDAEIARHSDQILEYSLKYLDSEIPGLDTTSVVIDIDTGKYTDFTIVFWSNGQFQMDYITEQDGKPEMVVHYEIITSPDEFVPKLGPHIAEIF